MAKKDSKSKQKRHQVKKARSGQKRKPQAKQALPLMDFDYDTDIDYDEDDEYPEDMQQIISTKSEYDSKLVEDGYRIVGPAQAMLDYAKPLVDKCESDDDMNKALRFAQLCWTIALMEDKELRAVENARKEIKRLRFPDADKLTDEMVQRFRLMFPEVGKAPSFYIKERVLDTDIEEFEPFDESTIKVSDELIPLTEKERELAEELPEMIDLEGDELLEFKDDLFDCYFDWCLAKGIPEDIAKYLPYAVNSFLDFLMDYYGEALSRRMPISAIEHFMRIHYIRKVWAPASEKVFMPIALKLFIRYLDEKGMMSNIKFLIRIIDLEQKIFIKNLKLYTNPSLDEKS